MANKKRSNQNLEKKETVAVEQENNKKNTNMIMLVVQFLLSLVTLVFAIIFIFNRNIIVGLQISLSLTLFATGINNIITYKRKFATILYFILGLALATLAVLTIIGI